MEATERLILEFNPAWTMSGGTGLYPPWLLDLARGGFDALETFSFDVVQPYSPEAWRGRIRASAGVKASLDAAAIGSRSREAPRVQQRVRTPRWPRSRAGDERGIGGVERVEGCVAVPGPLIVRHRRGALGADPDGLQERPRPRAAGNGAELRVAGEREEVQPAG